jgi:hypothetical protein
MPSSYGKSKSRRSRSIPESSSSSSGSSSEDDDDDDDDHRHHANNDKQNKLKLSLASLLESDDYASDDDLKLKSPRKPAATATARVTASATGRPSSSSSSFGLKLTRKAPRKSPSSAGSNTAQSDSRTSLGRKRKRPIPSSLNNRLNANAYKKNNDNSDSDSSGSLGIHVGIPTSKKKHVLSNNNKDNNKDDDAYCYGLEVKEQDDVSLSSVDTVELTQRIQSQYHSSVKKPKPQPRTTSAAAAPQAGTAPSWQNSPSSSSSPPLARQLPWSIRITTTSMHRDGPSSPMFKECQADADAVDGNNGNDYGDDDLDISNNHATNNNKNSNNNAASPLSPTWKNQLDDNSTGDASSVDTAELMRRIQGQHSQRQDPAVPISNYVRPPLDRSQRQSYLTSTARELPAEEPLHHQQPHQQRQPQASLQSHNPYHQTTGQSAAAAATGNQQQRQPQSSLQSHNPYHHPGVTIDDHARPIHNNDNNNFHDGDFSNNDDDKNDNDNHDGNFSNNDNNNNRDGNFSNNNDTAEEEEPIQDDFVLPDQDSSSSEDEDEDDDDDEIIVEQRITPHTSSLQRLHQAEPASHISVPPPPRTLTATAQHPTSRVAPLHGRERESVVSDYYQHAPANNTHDRHAPANNAHDRHAPSNALHHQPQQPFLTATATNNATALAAQNSHDATALNDEELQDAAFFATNNGASNHSQGVVDLCDSDDDDDHRVELDEYSSQNLTVREGLRSARKSPHFVTSSRRLSQPAPPKAAGDDDIQCFSDEDERPLDRFQSQSYLTSTTRTLPVQQPLHQQHQPQQRYPQSSIQSHNPYHQTTGQSAAPAVNGMLPNQQQQPQSSAQSHNPYNQTTGHSAAGAGNGMLPNRWQERPERQRRLRDAASSNTSFAQAVVRRPEPAATAHRWGSANSSTAAAAPAATAAVTSDNWFNQWTAARATGGGGDEHVRNDLVGGSGVGAGSYRLVDNNNAGTSNYDENFEPEHRAQPLARRNARGGKGGYSKKRTKGKARSKKGGKRGGGGRGRGRGRGGSRGAANNQNDSAGAWGDYGDGGGSAWSAQPSRDDPNLGHVGGAEMSF